jgi:HEAT repeat protein
MNVDLKQFKHIISELDNEDGIKRAAAARTLGILGNKMAVESLKKKLDDDDSVVRSAAANSLVLLGYQPEKYNEKAKLLIGREDWDALVDMGKYSLPMLMKFSNDGDERVRKQVEITIATIKLLNGH